MDCVASGVARNGLHKSCPLLHARFKWPSKPGVNIWEVAQRGELQAMLWHLLYGGVEAKDINDWTPLHFAALNGHVECMRALLEAGADKDSRSSTGLSALHWAALRGHVEGVRALLEAGADREIQDDDGWTALHDATWYDHVDCIRALLEAGADMNAQNKMGWTALHRAAVRFGNVKCVRALLEAGADPTITNNADQRPIDLTTNPDIRDLFEREWNR